MGRQGRRRDMGRWGGKGRDPTPHTFHHFPQFAEPGC